MRLRLLIVVALFHAAGSSLPAWGCYCSMSEPAVSYAQSDAVFVATPLAASGDEDVTTLAVESVQKGEVEQSVPLRRDRSDCGFFFEEGRRYQIFATRESSGYTTNVCSATTVAETIYAPEGSRPPVAADIFFVQKPARSEPDPGKAPVAVLAAVAAMAASAGLLRRRALRGSPVPREK